MSVNWTPEQLQAINARGSNILVAAAAGSGKTAVLVERIIRRVCDAENPSSIDRLLILTYTEAAAAEMKRKIADAIAKQIKENPDNEYLRRQGMLIHSAHISTIHAFCMAIIQNNIHKTAIPPDFSLIDDTENKLLKNQALDAVLESYYKRIEKKDAFRDLTVGYGGIKTDDNLRGTVLKLYEFVQSLAYPEKWLKTAADQYKKVVKANSVEGTVWEKLLVDICYDLSKEIKESLDAVMALIEDTVPHDHKCYIYYTDMYAEFNSLFSLVLNKSASYSELAESVTNFSIPRFYGKSGIDDDIIYTLESIRKEIISKNLKEMAELVNAANSENIEKIIKCSPRVQVLKQLVRQTERLHKSMKREKSFLDFNDLEHETIGLISTRKGEPTQLAIELQDRFDEILVDEYQDTSNIQDTMFRLISKDNKNIFMVGDLKQSIYRFRNAAPDIFAEKYREYLKGNGGICIRLFKNFRSRTQIIDSVNGLFSSIMKRETGGIDYTKEEYLVYGADYAEDCGNFTTEILLTDTDKNHYPDEYLEYSSNQLEAITVARRIRNMVDNCELYVKDKATNQPRPVRFGDITILIRNKSKAPELKEILEEYGISAYSEIGKSFLDSTEVMTVLSFLQIIDNPRQDIPLIAVLRSPMFNFSPDELCQIRLAIKGDFYDTLLSAAENGNKKARYFLNVLNNFRNNSSHMGVDEMIQRICYDLHYMAIAGSMPGGKLRQANLNLLYETGASFEKSGTSGLFNFMAYIESVRDVGGDLTPAKLFSENAETVSIMTIHKSKGLEYPVVFLYGTEQDFKESDASKSVIWHEDAGIAMDYVDTYNRVRYQSAPKLLLKERIKRQQRAEEMRLLYVALTRAKEKLIISSTISDRKSNWKKAIFSQAGEVIPGFIRRCLRTRDWMLAAFLSHPDSLILRKEAERMDIISKCDTGYNLEVRIINHATNPIDIISPDNEYNEEKTIKKITNEDILDRLLYEYPHTELSKTPLKLSVSEIKRRLMPDNNFVPSLPALNTSILTGTSQIGAAEKGTITHYVMQHLDYEKTNSAHEIEEQIIFMVNSGMISKRQADIVDIESIYSFFISPIGVRLKGAKRVERELDFYMEIPASVINPNIPDHDKTEPILLQGIADCVFFEGDNIILLDYKTDRVTEENAQARAEFYKTQIDYYAQALENILEKPVNERYLYFMNLNKTIKM